MEGGASQGTLAPGMGRVGEGRRRKQEGRQKG